MNNFTDKITLTGELRHADLGAQLRQRRVRAGLKPADLAQRMGLKRLATVYEVENGKFRASLDTYRKFAAALDSKINVTLEIQDIERN